MKNFVLGLVFVLILIAVIVLFKRMGEEKEPELRSLDEFSNIQEGDILPQ